MLPLFDDWIKYQTKLQKHVLSGVDNVALVDDSCLQRESTLLSIIKVRETASREGVPMPRDSRVR
jgi:hypothetical protein